MKNKLGYFLVTSGIILVLLGIFLGFTDSSIFSKLQFVRVDLVPIAAAFLGGLLLIMGVIAIVEKKYKSEAQKIEENDERNIIINQKAKSKAFDLMLIALSLSLLTLAILGYMNVVSLFSIAGIYLICVVYFLYNLVKMEYKI